MTDTPTYETDAQPGDLVFDLAQDERAPMVVTERCGPLAEIDDATADLVRKAHGNQVLGFDADTACVTAVYAALDSEAPREYTLPATRLRRPRIETAADGTAAELAQMHLLRQLFAVNYRADELTEPLRWAAQESTLPADLIDYADEMARLDAGVDL